MFGRRLRAKVLKPKINNTNQGTSCCVLWWLRTAILSNAVTKSTYACQPCSQGLFPKPGEKVPGNKVGTLVLFKKKLLRTAPPQHPLPPNPPCNMADLDVFALQAVSFISLQAWQIRNTFSHAHSPLRALRSIVLLEMREPTHSLKPTLP